MGHGSKSGAERTVFDLFIRSDGGYTTVAVALALLVSLTLVFSAAAAQWASARSSEVQQVADATALAGENAVAAFSTMAQVIDACVLSLGLTGVLVSGAGLVATVIPGCQEVGLRATELGGKILDARRKFATSSSNGLRRVERVLPALIALNSVSCVSANCMGGIDYYGMAVPFPQESRSDYASIVDDADGDEMADKAQELADEAKKKEDAEQRARDARERAWRADCVDNPMCMRSRAQTLAGLGGPSNPNYDSPSLWRFEYARIRARNYYLARAQGERPSSDSIAELTRSAAREQFYWYAFEVIDAGFCIEDGDSVIIELPELPYTSHMVRDTWLYTNVPWPCSFEEDEVVLHSVVDCPGYTGEGAGTATLADLESGVVSRCDVCGMDVGTMGSVASASTYISNGFEHYWRIVVEEAESYEQAKDEAREADERLREIGEAGASAFDRALQAISVDRPKLCPPGAWGCVAVVCRRDSLSVPSGLTSSFVASAELPPGIALAAATLAPDDHTDGGTVLTHVLDGLGDDKGMVLGLIGNVCDLWSRLLMSYGSAYESVSGIVDDLLNGLGSLFGERVATWIKGKISAIVKAAGFEPADMRLRKPVLVHSQEVLDQAGLSSLGTARVVLEEMPTSVDQIRSVNWERVMGELGVGEVTIAELPVPGLDGVGIPLTIDMGKVMGAL